MKKVFLAVVLLVALAAGCGTTTPTPAASESKSSVSIAPVPGDPIALLTDVEQWYQTLDEQWQIDWVRDNMFVRRLDEQYTLIYCGSVMSRFFFVLWDRQAEKATQVDVEGWIIDEGIYNLYYNQDDKELTFRYKEGRVASTPFDFPHSMTYCITTGGWSKAYSTIVDTEGSQYSTKPRSYRLGGTGHYANKIDRVEYTNTQLRLYFETTERRPDGPESYFPYIEMLYRPDTREVTLLLPKVALGQPGQLDGWGKLRGIENLQVLENQTMRSVLDERVEGTIVTFTLVADAQLGGSVQVGIDEEPTDHLMLEVRRVV